MTTTELYYTTELYEKYGAQIAEAIEDLQTPGRRHRQIPNILTTARLLSPLVIIPTALAGKSKEAMKLAALFGLTDLADGFIARTWDLSSPLGADLDALTDKIFAGALLLTGAVKNPYLLANAGLEVVISNINLKQIMAGREASSTKMGKIKTGLMFGLGGLGVVAPNQEKVDKAILPLAIATGAFQLLTIASYIQQYSDESDNQHSTADGKTLLDWLRATREFLHQGLDNIQEKTSSAHQKIKVDRKG